MPRLSLDTTPYRQLWRKAKPLHRLTVHWLWEHADAAGVWEVDADLFAFENGFELDVPALMADLGGLVVELPGNKLMLPDLIAVNYGVLRPTCPPHRGVLALLARHGLVQVNGDVVPVATHNNTSQHATDDAAKPPVEPTVALPAKPAKAARKAASNKGYGKDDGGHAYTDSVKAVMTSLRDANGGNLDGSEKANQRAARTLLNKMAAKFPNHPPETTVIRLITAAKKDKFHGPNTTNFQYLVRYSERIIQSITKTTGTTPPADRSEYFARAFAAAVGPAVPEPA